MQAIQNCYNNCVFEVQLYTRRYNKYKHACILPKSPIVNIRIGLRFEKINVCLDLI